MGYRAPSTENAYRNLLPVDGRRLSDKFYDWSNDGHEGQRWVHWALLRRGRTRWLSNVGDPFGRDGTAARWKD